MKRFWFLFCWFTIHPVFATEAPPYAETEDSGDDFVLVSGEQQTEIKKSPPPIEPTPTYSKHPATIQNIDEAKATILRTYFPNLQLDEKEFAYLQENFLDDALIGIGAQLAILEKNRNAIAARTLDISRLTLLAQGATQAFNFFFNSLELNGLKDSTAGDIYRKFIDNAQKQLAGIEAATEQADAAWKRNQRVVIVVAAVCLALAIGSGAYALYYFSSLVEAAIPAGLSCLSLGTAGMGAKTARNYQRHRAANQGLQDTVRNATARLQNLLLPSSRFVVSM